MYSDIEKPKSLNSKAIQGTWCLQVERTGEQTLIWSRCNWIWIKRVLPEKLTSEYWVLSGRTVWKPWELQDWGNLAGLRESHWALPENNGKSTKKCSLGMLLERRAAACEKNMNLYLGPSLLFLLWGKSLDLWRRGQQTLLFLLQW